MGNESSDLKHLTVLRDRAEHALALIRQEQSAVDQKMRQAVRELASVDAQIQRLRESTKKAKAVMVSEHSILRYLERVRGVDLDQVKKEIMPEATIQRIRAMGNGEYPVGGSHTLRVRDNTVITVLTKEERPPQKEREQAPEPAPEPIVEAPKPMGDHECFRCKEPAPRLLKGGLCDTCVQEDMMDLDP
jgi:hypothetical protein